MKKIFIGVPNTGFLKTELVEWLFRLKNDDKFKTTLFFPQNRPHDYNRNVIVTEFLKTDNDYLLMIDSDVVPVSNVLELANFDVGIVSGYVKAYKNGETIPIGMKKVKGGYKVKSPLKVGMNEVDAVGTGCLMVKREVFEKMDKPYFRFQYDENGFLSNGEDFHFCEKAKQLGYKIYFNGSYPAQHFTLVNI